MVFHTVMNKIGRPAISMSIRIFSLFSFPFKNSVITDLQYIYFYYSQKYLSCPNIIFFLLYYKYNSFCYQQVYISFGRIIFHTPFSTTNIISLLFFALGVSFHALSYCQFLIYCIVFYSSVYYLIPQYRTLMQIQLFYYTKARIRTFLPKRRTPSKSPRLSILSIKCLLAMSSICLFQ